MRDVKESLDVQNDSRVHSSRLHRSGESRDRKAVVYDSGRNSIDASYSSPLGASRSHEPGVRGFRSRRGGRHGHAADPASGGDPEQTVKRAETHREVCVCGVT